MNYSFLQRAEVHSWSAPKDCKRLGHEPSESRPVKLCWYQCFSESMHRVYKQKETYGAPCIGRYKHMPTGYCYGTSCYQDRFGRRPPWKPAETPGQKPGTPGDGTKIAPPPGRSSSPDAAKQSGCGGANVVATTKAPATTLETKATPKGVNKTVATTRRPSPQ
ncbi:hypothetical protein V5799_023527 [Amblyomma americanum]|uniref:Uncharacterized protein n=1 Tax=Amblyomma americanum TaxID=6943 RepID=A0AAQ4FJE3_AMBAM